MFQALQMEVIPANIKEMYNGDRAVDLSPLQSLDSPLRHVWKNAPVWLMGAAYAYFFPRTFAVTSIGSIAWVELSIQTFRRVGEKQDKMQPLADKVKPFERSDHNIYRPFNYLQALCLPIRLGVLFGGPFMGMLMVKLTPYGKPFNQWLSGMMMWVCFSADLCEFGDRPTDPSMTVVPNHVSCVDILIVMHTLFCSFCANTGVKKVFVAGDAASALDCVWVPRGDADGRAKAQQLIIDRQQELREGKKKSFFTIFPEGCVCNNTFMIPLKKGAFMGAASGRASEYIQPAVIKYSPAAPNHSIHLSFCSIPEFGGFIPLALTGLWTTIQVHWLKPVKCPERKSGETVEDLADRFAQLVQDKMTQAIVTADGGTLKTLPGSMRAAKELCIQLGIAFPDDAKGVPDSPEVSRATSRVDIALTEQKAPLVQNAH